METGGTGLESAGRLDKVEAIRTRTGVSYSEAAALLDEADGDVVQALIFYEQRGRAKDRGAQWDSFEAKGNEILAQIKEIIKRGNVTKVVIKKDGRVVVELPITAGVIGAVVSPQLALLGSAACLLGRCTVEIVRPGEPNTVLNLDDDAHDAHPED